MYRLSGEYECKVDAKGRLRLPAGLLRQLGESASKSFTLNRGFEKCVIVYPASVWKTFTTALQKLNPFITKNREFIRAFYRGASPVTADSNDRILLPKGLVDHAGISKDVVVNAYGGFIEIWDKKSYMNMVGKVKSDDLAGMAEDVFGSFPGFDFISDDQS